jgi:hypothetical protein
MGSPDDLSKIVRLAEILLESGVFTNVRFRTRLRGHAFPGG